RRKIALVISVIGDQRSRRRIHASISGPEWFLRRCSNQSGAQVTPLKDRDLTRANVERSRARLACSWRCTDLDGANDCGGLSPASARCNRRRRSFTPVSVRDIGSASTGIGELGSYCAASKASSESSL